MRVLAWPKELPGNRNPYVTQLVTSLEREGVEIGRFGRKALVSGEWDIVHVHWPDVPLRETSRFTAGIQAAVLLACFALARMRGTKICWTVHNLRPHESPHPRLDRLFWAAYTRLVSGAISLTASAIPEIREEYSALKRKPVVVVPHGHYRDAYPASPTRADARDAVGVKADERVVLFLGQIRRYKGLPSLVRALEGVDQPNVRLVVAGSVTEKGLESYLKLAASQDDRISLRLGFVEPQEIPLLIAASDLVALPYRQVLNSGSAILALSFDRPVLVPSTASFDELGNVVGDSWVLRYDDDLDAHALSAALAAAPGPASQGPDISTLEWDAIGRATAAFYRRLADVDLTTPSRESPTRCSATSRGGLGR